MKKFKKNNKRNTMLIIAVVIVVGLVVSTTLIKSHANFSTSKSFNIIQGKIPNKNNGDVTLAVKLDGNKYKEEGFPSKEGHIFKGYDCGDNKEVNVMWDKNTWSVSLSNIKTKTTCILEFETKTNLDLNGSEPVVKEGLVPVVIANDGTVTKTTTDDMNWYDYNESKWANAVILTGTDNYSVGEPIPEEAIESYFVWIPKYRYKLFNVEGNSIPEQEIEIEIGDYNTKDIDTECIAPNISGDIGNCKNLNDEKGNGKWMTHPAFTSLGVNGIWVGKFETGYKGSTDTASAQKNENAPEKVQIKPNVNSWRSINVSNMYNTSFNYKRSLDSHMMKNTEWGAMAYLTNSKYGRKNSEVWINNSSTFTTGCTGSGVSVEQSTTCATPYFSNTAIKEGSTTRNMSGIYDTSGGAWDTVMGNLNNTTSSSGFPINLGIDSKYYDKYTGIDLSARILGDAVQETYGWNGDLISFVDSSYPWFYRGGIYDNATTVGVFCFGWGTGGAHRDWGFRIVLSPSN